MLREGAMASCTCEDEYGILDTKDVLYTTACFKFALGLAADLFGMYIVLHSCLD